VRFLAYYGLFLRRLWADLRSGTKGIAVSVIVAVSVVILQFWYGLTRKDQIAASIIARAAPYFGILLFLVLYHGVRTAWKLHSEEIASHADDLEGAIAKFQREAGHLVEENAALKVQLQEPHIVSEILKCEIEEERRRDANDGPLAILNGTTDCRIHLFIRLSNEHRVSSVIETYGVQVFPRSGLSRVGSEEGIDVNNPHRPELNTNSTVEFGLPRSGWLLFRAEHTRHIDLGGGRVVFSITDGRKNLTTAEFRIP